MTRQLCCEGKGKPTKAPLCSDRSLGAGQGLFREGGILAASSRNVDLPARPLDGHRLRSNPAWRLMGIAPAAASLPKRFGAGSCSDQGVPCCACPGFFTLNSTLLSIQ